MYIVKLVKPVKPSQSDVTQIDLCRDSREPARDDSLTEETRNVVHSLGSHTLASRTGCEPVRHWISPAMAKKRERERVVPSVTTEEHQNARVCSAVCQFLLHPRPHICSCGIRFVPALCQLFCTISCLCVWRPRRASVPPCMGEAKDIR